MPSLCCLTVPDKRGSYVHMKLTSYVHDSHIVHAHETQNPCFTTVPGTRNNFVSSHKPTRRGTLLTPCALLGLCKRPVEGLWRSDRECDPQVYPADSGGHVIPAQQHDRASGHQG